MDGAPATEPVRARSRLWMALLIGAIAGAPSLFNAPVYDDELLIFSNRFAHDSSYFFDNLTADFFYASNLPGGQGGYYRPVMKLAFMAQFAAFGHDVLGYRLLGMAGFLLAIALGASVARRLGLSQDAVVVGATLGAAHPVFASALGPITSQSDLFAAAGVLGCVFAYLRACDRPPSREGMLNENGGSGRALWLGVALFAETLAVGCKESAALTPAVIACIASARPKDGCAMGERASRMRVLGDVALFLIPVALYVIARLALQILPVSEGRSGGSLAAIATGSKLFCSATLRALLPTAWNPLVHALRPTGSLADLAAFVLPALAIGLAASVAFVRTPRLRPWLALFLTPLAPIVLAESMIHTGDDATRVLLPDRWLVVPALIGSYALGAVFVFARDALRAPLRPLATAGLLMWLAVQMALTLEEMASYRTENTRAIHLAGLYREHGLTDPFAREVILGADAIVAEASGDARAAAAAYSELAALRPNDVLNRYNLAVMLLRSGDLQAAYEAAYLAYHGTSRDGALHLTPDDSTNRRRPERAYLLAQLSERLGDRDGAIRYFRECIAMRPDFPGAHEALIRLESR